MFVFFLLSALPTTQGNIYNSMACLKMLKLLLKSSQTVTHTAVGTLPGTAMHHSNTAQSR